MQRPFHGIIPPLVTPLRDRDELDEPGLERLIEHVLAGGVHGLFLLGTTGEAPSLGYGLRRRFLSRVAALVKGRVPLLVGITDTAFVESVGIARHAAEIGAAAVVLATPYYFPAGQTELIGYVERLLPELPLPVMLYNMPSLTKVAFETETLARLAEQPRIIGLKDSGGDLDYFQRALALRDARRPDWSIFIGPEALLPDALSLGADGGVAGGANIYPRLFVDCHRAFRTGDHARVAALRAGILDLQRIYDIGKYPSRHIKATKCALSIKGLCDDFLAEPFHRFYPDDRAKVARILAEVERRLNP
jgi:4-hydroxy-tetrahydrodipicolinate synthase